MNDATVNLKVLNPRGALDTSKVRGINPRVPDINGKTIGLYWNGKPDGDLFWDTVEGILKERYPDVTVVRYFGPGDLGETTALKVAEEVDAVMYGVGD